MSGSSATRDLRTFPGLPFLQPTSLSFSMDAALLSPRNTDARTLMQHDSSTSLKRKATSPPRESAAPRKTRACHECRRLKMKCEVLPDETRCTRCRKKDLECGFKPVDTLAPSIVAEYDQKLESMRQDIQSLKRGFDIVLNALGQKNQPAQPSPSGFSDSVVSARSCRENRAMAMTRENSPEPGARNQAQNSLLVPEPMGSLYEVTRLRNIRSNQAKVVRHRDEDDQNIDDFITRGVSSKRCSSDEDSLDWDLRASWTHPRAFLLALMCVPIPDHALDSCYLCSSHATRADLISDRSLTKTKPKNCLRRECTRCNDWARLI